MTEPKPTNLRINGQRYWDSLMEMAKIGATPKGGCNRQTLTDLDREGRELFRRAEELLCDSPLKVFAGFYVIAFQKSEAR